MKCPYDFDFSSLLLYYAILCCTMQYPISRPLLPFPGQINLNTLHVWLLKMSGLSCRRCSTTVYLEYHIPRGAQSTEHDKPPRISHKDTTLYLKLSVSYQNNGFQAAVAHSSAANAEFNQLNLTEHGAVELENKDPSVSVVYRRRLVVYLW